MSHLTINIDLDNDAFGDNDIALWQQVASTITKGIDNVRRFSDPSEREDSVTLRDAFGNDVGEMEYELPSRMRDFTVTVEFSVSATDEDTARDGVESTLAYSESGEGWELESADIVSVDEQ